MKKYFVIAICLVIVGTIFCTGTPAVKEETKSSAAASSASKAEPEVAAISFPFSTGFDDMTIGEQPKGFKVYGDAQSTCTVVDGKTIKAASGTACVLLADNSSADTPEMVLMFDAEHSKGTVKYAVFNPSQKTGEVYCTVGKGKDSAGRVVDIIFSANGNVKYRDKEGLHEIAPYTFDEWHAAVITWDISSGVFSLSVDGKKLIDNYVISNLVPDLVDFKVGSNAKVDQAGYLDDVSVSFN